jgi:glyoxylase-like metal-dependent hydrolase (beta-lactamase superfamily II)
VTSSMDITEVDPGPEPIVPGVARALSPLVRRILATNPGPLTLTGTNTYLIGIDEIVVIDPGPDDEDHVDSIAGCGGDRIRWITVTRDHPEHGGAIDRLVAATGAEVLTLGDKKTLLGTEFRITAHNAPGPSADHMVFLLEEERFLFAGDLLTDQGTAALDPDTGDLNAYLDTLEACTGRRLKRIAPAHGHILDKPMAAIADAMSRRHEREGQVIDALGAGLRTPADIAAKVYAGIDPELAPTCEAMVRHHLAKLAKEKKAKHRGDNWSLA